MYNYYVIEIQTNHDGTSGNFVTGFEDKDTSEDAFLQTRAAANDSSVMIHTVMWIDNKGNNMEKPACYIHPAVLPPSVEPEG